MADATETQNSADLQLSHLRKACIQLIKHFASTSNHSDEQVINLLGDHTQYYFRVRSNAAVKLEQLLGVTLRLGFSLEYSFLDQAGEKLQ